MQGQPAGRTKLHPHICSVGASWSRWNRLTSWRPIMFVQILTSWDMWGGEQNLVALVSFFSFIFSQTFNLADPLYLLTRQPSTCRLPRLQKKKSMALAKLKPVFLLRGVVLMVNILDIVTDSLRQLELPSRAWRLKSDTNNSFPLRRSELNGHSLISSTH